MQLFKLQLVEIKNIGTPSVQELFFCDRSISRTVGSNDLFKFFGCDVQQERNWEDSKHLVGTSGDDSSVLIEFTPL